jgi:tetratricopeptide (TPR) repeat protein
MPPGVPSPKELLREEESLKQLISSISTNFVRTIPGLIEDSFAGVWAPRFLGQAAGLDSLAAHELGRYKELQGRMAAALSDLEHDDGLTALRERTRVLEARADSLDVVYAELRRNVARRGIERSLAALENEREAIDYGLTASVYEMNINTLRAGGQNLADSLSQGQRDEARARLEHFLEAYPNSPARGETRFRLADLLLVHAKGEFNRRMTRFLSDELPADGIDDRALVPFVDYDPALALYREILEKDPGFPHRDAVLFNLGMILSDQGKPEARGHLQDLVTSFPESPFGQEAHLRLGDDLFDRSRFADCISLYEEAASGSDPGLTAIALYRMGWAHFSEDQFEASADAFRRLLDHYGSGQEIVLKTDLRTEAEDYFIHSMVRGGGAGFFAEYFDRIGLRPYEARTLQGMSQLLREFSLYAEAVETDDLYLARYPDDPGAMAGAKRLVDSYERWNHPRDAREARLALAPRFVPGSRWYNLNPADSLQREAEEFSRSSYQFVALYHHHRARAGKGNPESWEQALTLYDTLLEYWPHHKESAKYHLYSGEAAAKLDQYALALMHYETAVFEFYSREAMVESLEDLESNIQFYTVKLSPEIYKYVLDADWQRLAITDTWYRSTIAASDSGRALGTDSLAVAVRVVAEGFLRRHGSDERAPEALWRKATLGFAHGWYEPAAEDFGQMMKLFPGDERVPGAAALRGDALYEAQLFDRARSAYENALRVAAEAGADSLVHRITPVIPLCAYRHAEEMALEFSNQPAKWASLFEEVATKWPGYEHTGTALYRAGLGYSEGGLSEPAVRAWSLLLDRYPEHEYARDAHLQIANTWESAERFDLAALAYERISNTYPEDANAPESLLRAGDLWEKYGDTAGAESLRLRYVERFPEDFETGMTILFTLAEKELESLAPGVPISSLLENEEPRSRLGQYLELAEAHPEFALPELQGKVQFLKGEEVYAEYIALQLTLPIERSIETKKNRLEKLLLVYGKCSEFGAPVWTRAATYRIGEALVGFGEALETSERPPDLTGDDLAAYDEVLAEEAWAFYDRGEEVWSELLRETQGADEDTGGWIAKTRETLWPRLSQRFYYMPEVEYPILPAGEQPVPVAPGKTDTLQTSQEKQGKSGKSRELETSETSGEENEDTPSYGAAKEDPDDKEKKD